MVKVRFPNENSSESFRTGFFYEKQGIFNEWSFRLLDWPENKNSIIRIVKNFITNKKIIFGKPGTQKKPIPKLSRCSLFVLIRRTQLGKTPPCIGVSDFVNRRYFLEFLHWKISRKNTSWKMKLSGLTFLWCSVKVQFWDFRRNSCRKLWLSENYRKYTR